MARFFKVPFALSGTKSTIPDEKQADGSMSMQEGYNENYERNPLTDAKSKKIERDRMNYLFYAITDALGEIQRYGLPTWNEVIAPYELGTVCYFNNEVWKSKIAENSDKPGITDNWEKLSGGGDNKPTGDYYTKDEINKMIQSIYEGIDNIKLHEEGEFFLTSKIILNTNKELFICNNKWVPKNSNLGYKLNEFKVYDSETPNKELPLKFVEILQTEQYISLPNFIRNANDGFEFSIPFLGGIAGVTGDLPWNKENTTFKGKTVSFVPVIYIDSKISSLQTTGLSSFIDISIDNDYYFNNKTGKLPTDNKATSFKINFLYNGEIITFDDINNFDYSKVKIKEINNVIEIDGTDTYSGVKDFFHIDLNNKPEDLLTIFLEDDVSNDNTSYMKYVRSTWGRINSNTGGYTLLKGIEITLDFAGQTYKDGTVLNEVKMRTLFNQKITQLT